MLLVWLDKDRVEREKKNEKSKVDLWTNQQQHAKKTPNSLPAIPLDARIANISNATFASSIAHNHQRAKLKSP